VDDETAGRGMTPEEWGTAIEQWLRPESAPAYRAAMDWLLPRCRTEEERALAPVLLLLLAPLNALVAPCRPLDGSQVNFQVTLSREAQGGPERVRLTLRTTQAAASDQPVSAPAAEPQPLGVSPAGIEDAVTVLALSESAVLTQPLACAASVLEGLLRRREQR
jgi:hypothetical protein